MFRDTLFIIRNKERCFMTYENEIKDFDGNVWSRKDMMSKIKWYLDNDYSICVGSDSQMHYESTVMVTSVVVYNHMKGNNCFYFKDYVDNSKYPTLRSRIMDEGFRSLELAIILKEKFGCNIEIHLDIGDDPEINKTHEFVSELTGIMSSQGFDVKIKPESFASSGFADLFTK